MTKIGYYLTPKGTAPAAFALTLRCPWSGPSGSPCTCAHIQDVKVVIPGEPPPHSMTQTP